MMPTLYPTLYAPPSAPLPCPAGSKPVPGATRAMASRRAAPVHVVDAAAAGRHEVLGQLAEQITSTHVISPSFHYPAEDASDLLHPNNSACIAPTSTRVPVRADSLHASISTQVARVDLCIHSRPSPVVIARAKASSCSTSSATMSVCMSCKLRFSTLFEQESGVIPASGTPPDLAYEIGGPRQLLGRTGFAAPSRTQRNFRRTARAAGLSPP